MKLLIRNLARTITEAELKKMFEAHGSVQSCTLVLDKETGGSKGFGFVEMPKVGDAKAAIKNLNNQDVGGSRIRVKKAEEASDAPAKSESPQKPAKPEKADARKSRGSR
ncbi:MAG: RNA-binding protein [Gammaproteobacteria bacterium]|nr:RNA-binding protein [Gammaproteobacteria bacterium]